MMRGDHGPTEFTPVKVFQLLLIDHAMCYQGHRKHVTSRLSLISRVHNREGEYPTSLWACVTTLYGVHDLCNDIHMLEASVLAVCGHVAKPQVQ